MNLASYAKHVNRSGAMISKWLRKGCLLESAVTRTGRNVDINVEVADVLIEMMLNKSKSRRKKINVPDQLPASGKSTYGYADAITKDKYYAAALKKIALDEKNGILILKTDSDKEAFDCARTTRDAILNISGRISSILAATNDENEVDKILTKEHLQALEGLSEG